MLELLLNYGTISVAAIVFVILLVLLVAKRGKLPKKPKTIICYVCGIIAIYFVFVLVLVFAFGNTHTSDEPKPVENSISLEYAEQLWDARTEYVGDASAIGKLVGRLPTPNGLQYDHFELRTNEQPYTMTVYYKVDEKTRDLATEAENKAPLKRMALVLLALIDNADSVVISLDDGKNSYSEDYTRVWADSQMDGDVHSYAETPQKLAELLEFPLNDTQVSGGAGSSYTESPTASYHFTRYGKDGEVISIAALTDEELAERIIMDVTAKSAAWQGVDVATLTEYYLIEQTFGTGEKSEYYAYLLDDKAVLQRGNNGLYSYLSQELYDELDGIYTDAVERTEP